MHNVCLLFFFPFFSYQRSVAHVHSTNLQTMYVEGNYDTFYRLPFTRSSPGFKRATKGAEVRDKRDGQRYAHSARPSRRGSDLPFGYALSLGSGIEYSVITQGKIRVISTLLIRYLVIRSISSVKYTTILTEVLPPEQQIQPIPTVLRGYWLISPWQIRII